jgi:flagellar motor switch protein FliG
VVPAELARILAAEHPQTAAIVVAHLSPARAAEVIEHLPLPQQSDTLMRIARLTTPHPDVIRDLEHEIQALLSNRQSLDQVGPQGLAKVEAILQHAADAARQQLVTDLAQQDRTLVHQLRVTDTPVACPPETVVQPGEIAGPQRDHRDSTAKPFVHDKNGHTPDATKVTFADLETLDEKALALLLHHVTSNTTLLALAGASHQFVQRILAQLPDREAHQLERKIRHIGPLRLDDVQRAQRQLTEIAQQFVNEGKLMIPGKQRLSVAA